MWTPSMEQGWSYTQSKPAIIWTLGLFLLKFLPRWHLWILLGIYNNKHLRAMMSSEEAGFLAMSSKDIFGASVFSSRLKTDLKR
uniref:Uncharacterized protein n=1 Tax=Pyxicephalus adspersus TaxID=30357 RepID=A0AAV2ZZC3_PYXAD|nr:TPA: hypothetical protein GDO54_011694 [Pyxicephalus adspersus]